MAVKQDYYKVLGIDRNADDKTIKKAYRKMAKKYHPDMNPGDAVAEQKFKEITEAYNVLSDSEKKKLYDQFVMPHLKKDFRRETGSPMMDLIEHTESIISPEMHRIFLEIYLEICLMTATLVVMEVLEVLVTTMVLDKVAELAVAAALMRTDILEDMVDFREHIFTAQEVGSRSLVMI